jgi:hypothetical protein
MEQLKEKEYILNEGKGKGYTSKDRPGTETLKTRK